VLGLTQVIGEFWSGGPSWLREYLRPDKPVTTPEKVLDLVEIVCFIAALYFYFFGERRTAAAP
jgi:hypothetical protein